MRLAGHNFELNKLIHGDAMTPQVKLVVMNGSLQGSEFDFEGTKSCIIGRSQDCDIAFNRYEENCDMSRRHSLLRIEAPRAWLRDLNSKNGTFVNERRISTAEIELSDGDEIRIGHVIMKIEMLTPSSIDFMSSAYAGWIP